MRRAIKHIFKGEPVTEGAGVKLRRLFGYYETSLFDPFLMLDDFRSDTPEDFIRGFPWHPHRGIETITYVTRGDVEHGDSLGNAGVIGAGDVQWMTAGGGVLHQEMPKGDAHGAMHGFQLWANLPARDKLTAPRYQGVTAEEIPVVTLPEGTMVKVIAGVVEGVAGPVDDVAIKPEYMECTVPAGVEFIHPTTQGHTAFVYVTGGAGLVNGTPVADGALVLFEDGDELAVTGGGEPLRFLLCTGKPLGEPIAWRGPIVMNTQEELDAAFRELDAGTFVKHPAAS